MEKKYIKLNDNYSHLSLGNIINVIKEESKNKTSAIQSEVFATIFDIDLVNESTVNNYCIGSRSIGSDYKQIYINLKNKYNKDKDVFIKIVSNILSIVMGSIYDIKDVKEINANVYLQNICKKLYNISKNDFYVSKEYTNNFRKLLNNKNYYSLFVEFLLYAILEKKQPLYEDEKIQNMVATILENTDISVRDLQNFLVLELKEGSSFSHSLINLANENNSYANYHLAVMEYRGEFSGTPRYDKAYDYFIKAAEFNHPTAYWMLGNMILKGKLGVPNENDLKKCVYYFEKAKSLGSVAAINSLGICYKYGYGVSKDIDKALELFKEGDSKNYVYATNNLGIIKESNKEYEEAFKYFLKSANLNESFACNKVGEYYRHNHKLKDAFFYYQKALNVSLKEVSLWAYYNLAKYFYLNGSIECEILPSLNIAIEYFEKSSNLIVSLIELLNIYYSKYLETHQKEDQEKIYYYKEKIENHPDFNIDIKKEIEQKLNILNNRIALDLDIKKSE